MAELTNEDEVVALFVAAESMKYLVASNSGRGFVVPGTELAPEKRTGKQILNLKPGEEAVLCIQADGDHVAIVGENRRLLVFPLEQVPEMARGAGVILQRYKDGGLSDAKIFHSSEGLSWRLGDRVRTETNIQPWVAERATSGRMLPNGFPRSLKFGG
jgi:topoisomerase IV subunit A